MKPANSKIIVNNRDAKTGQFVTERYAKTHPATTVTEKNKLSSGPAKKK